MVARRGLDFSAATSIAAGFGEVLHSCRAMQQQSEIEVRFFDRDSIPCSQVIQLFTGTMRAPFRH